MQLTDNQSVTLTGKVSIYKDEAKGGFSIWLYLHIPVAAQRGQLGLRWEDFAKENMIEGAHICSFSADTHFISFGVSGSEDSTIESKVKETKEWIDRINKSYEKYLIGTKEQSDKEEHFAKTTSEKIKKRVNFCLTELGIVPIEDDSWSQ